MRTGKGGRFFPAVAAMALVWLPFGGTPQKSPKVSREEGEYRISAAGKEIGVEKYAMVASGNAVTSTSILEFRNPGSGPRKIQLETKLEMDENYLPRSYELKSEVDGQKGSILGQFAPNQVIFEYAGGGRSVRNGLLLGNRFTILDTNVFHHFIFLTRLFKYNGGANPQSFEVVIPQEKDTGTLKIKELNKETLVIKGKKISTVHLLVDSGALKIHLWVDGNRVPRKIAVPDKGIEVLHNN